MNRIYSSLIKNVFRLLVSSKLLDFIPYIFPENLTVLNYHRINDPTEKDFSTLKVNVSATPVDFAKQMSYVKEHFNVINCAQLIAWLDGKASLPPRPALITFDDGYYDNFENAYPVLKTLNLPAVIFLATAFIGKDTPFYWDYIAYCFFKTNKKSASLPLLGECSWVDDASREQTIHSWVEALKKVPEEEKLQYVQKIAELLEVFIPNDAFANLHLNWDHVREMSLQGIEFGAHTVNHPILTRISLEQVKDELYNSKKKVGEETGFPVLSFAYPNGGVQDFSQEIVTIAGQVGFRLAFTLLPGPVKLKAVKEEPLAIRRIYIGNHDDYARFVFKVSGVARFLNR